MSTSTTTEPEEMDFGGLRIAYDSRVLEPRPWTAAQSEWAAEILQAAPGGDVLELCSGGTRWSSPERPATSVAVRTTRGRR